jgi:phosphate:Na+ symporter
MGTFSNGMNGTLLLIELAGHVGLLLWGTHMVSTGVQRGFGPMMRHWLRRNLDSPARAFLTGIGITTLLQSSTATGLLATSLASTGVLALAPALAVMLGANVGTALLTQLFSFNMGLAGPPLVLAGVLAFRWATDGRLKSVGRIGIGLGLMLMALAGLVHTLAPLASAPLLRPVLGSLSSDPVLAVALAAFLTWACHSSIAIVLLIGSFEAIHVVSPTGALALVLGANLGGALPALLNASTRTAYRLPLGNLLVRATGVVLTLPFLPQIAAMLDRYEADPSRLVVNFHLCFNTALAMIFLLPAGALARQLERWLPEARAPADPGRAQHLDSAALDSATVALANAARETLRMADMIDVMLRDTLRVISRDSVEPPEGVADAAHSVGQLGASIRRYLAGIGEEQPLDNPREAARSQDILSAVINLEHVADILANSFVNFTLRGLKRGKRFSAEEAGIVAAMHAELLDCLRLALAVFLQADPEDATRLVASKNTFREFEKEAMKLSARSLRSAAAGNRPVEPQIPERVGDESGLLLRSVRDLRRIHSHLASFAYPILHRQQGRPADPASAVAGIAGRAATP